MSHSSHWVVDKRVLYIKYTGVIEREELDILNEELIEYMEYGEAPIHIISDSNEMGRLSIGVKAFRSSLAVMGDDRWGWVMVVGAGPITKFFGQLLSITFRLKLRLVDTQHQAYFALNAEDVTLSNLLIEESESES